MNADLKADVQTVGALRRAASVRLRDAAIETAELDVRVLLQHALAVDGVTLMARPEFPLPIEAEVKFESLLRRRLSGEPIARIVGFKEFWSHSFRLGPDMLVPRPETETVVEAALAANPDRERAFSVLDLGTGAGVLLASILLERPMAAGVAMDRSERALKVARENLISLGLEKRAKFVCGDWGDAFAQSFDLVVSNPPYVCTKDISQLPREVRAYDPHLALDGGRDGLAAYRAIIAQLSWLLAPNGIAVFELGLGQESAVVNLAREAKLIVKEPAKCDLAGIPRALILLQQG
jgi:release factor glutamine methyltransferase